VPKHAKRVIVTGASGFIGANLTRRLLRDGHDVHLLLRPAEHRWRLEAVMPHVAIHEVAVEQREFLEMVVREIDPDWVFHLAAYGCYSSQRDIRRIVETNFTGTVNLVEACIKTGFEAFVNAGSSSEYGYKSHAPLESELPEPNSHYAATKAAATLYCQFAANHYQRRLTTLRFYSIFGPWEEPTRLMPTLLLAGLRGELPPLVSPTTAHDFVYVDDAVEALLLAAETVHDQPGAVFNVGTGIQTTMRDLVETVRRQLGVSASPVWGSMPNRQWDTDVWFSDCSAVEACLGWKPSYALEDGLRAFVAWLESEPGIRPRYEAPRKPPQ